MPVRNVSAGRVAAVALVGLTAWTAVACSSSAPPSANGGASPASTSGEASPASTSGGASPATTAPAGVAGTGGTSANAASTSECANAPSALVSSDLKLAVGKLTATAEGPVTVCAYAGRYEVLVRYQTGETTAEFAQARTAQAGLHQAVGTVNGLGAAAYLASYTARKPFSYTLGALQGDIAIFVTSPASLGAESALMTDLLKKV
jgi:hypothetical protein